MTLIPKEILLSHLQRAEGAEEVSLPIGFFRDLLYQAMPKQEQGEPVAEITVKNGHWIDTTGFSAVKKLADGIHKLYTTPQPKQEQGEPVAKAWAEGYRMGIADERTSEANIGIAGFNAKVEPDRQNPYGIPQPKQEQGEPVKSVGDFSDWLVLPPAAQQRTWVGLTDEEIDAEADKEEQAYGFIQGVAWAEAKLKEKNT